MNPHLHPLPFKPKSEYRVLSLFSGIGGLCHWGITIAGMLGLESKYTVRQFVENSSYAQNELRSLAPHTPIHSDICNFHTHPGLFDIVCGGFPCAGTSDAGNRKGLKDPRSGLWREMFRVIQQAQPTVVLIENPKGLLSRGLGKILQDFASIRFDAEWITVSAQQVGLPQKRERVFIVTYPHELQFHQLKSPWEDEVGIISSRIQELTGSRSYQPGISQVVNGIPIGVKQGLPGNFAARRAYGLSCSPRQSAIAWSRIDYLLN